MKQSIYKAYNDLPLFLNAAMVSQVLGISVASSYELMHPPLMAAWECSRTGWQSSSTS